MSGSSSRSSSPCPANNRPYIATRRHRSNIDYGESLTTQLQSVGLYGVDVYQWKDDDLSFRSAAAQSRLPYDQLDDLELKFFSYVTKDRSTTMLYLFCRNKILVLWNLDPLVELTLADVVKEIPSPYNGDLKLISKIHAFLQRYGFINFGAFLNLSKNLIASKPKVLIIGAGPAGLGAACQLKFFGFDVKILEARPRIGGRVMTYMMDGNPVDLGAQIVMGISSLIFFDYVKIINLAGNPIVTLVKQIPIELIRISQHCPIFDSNGKMVDARKDDMIQNCFNKILSTCSYIAHGLGITEIENKKLSLGQTFDAIIKQQELRILKKRVTYYQKYREIGQTICDLNKKLLLYKITIEKSMEEIMKIVDINTVTIEDIFIPYEKITNEDEFNKALKLRTLRYTLSTAMQAYSDTEKQRKELERVFTEFKCMEPSQVYMNATDKRILDFHLANLEYGIGASVYSASLKDWDHDDNFSFDGSHMMIKEGYIQIFKELAKDLDIKVEHIVNSIKYDKSGVVVNYTYKTTKLKEKIQSEHADAVICTVPLGVLKCCIMPDTTDSIKFEPPLPKWKTKSIANLGYGSLNKIVLVFESIFWDTNIHTFARLNEANVARGEMFMFFSNGKSPVLTGLLAGESANVIDEKREEFLINKSMNILQNIFGSACPKKPINHIVTLWHLDRYSRGCYSYVTTNSSADDYDVLAQPICDANGTPRLFFAGEHTNRQHTATVHGAYLSGLREAANVADSIVGPVVKESFKDFKQSEEKLHNETI